MRQVAPLSCVPTRFHMPTTPTDATVAETLSRFLREQLPAGCAGEVHAIEAGDEHLLRAGEGRGMERAVASVRRASGRGREVARRLCTKIGSPVDEIPRSPARYPMWPGGILGSIAHDSAFAAAVVAPAGQLSGIGIDIEPCEALAPGIAGIVAHPAELAAFSDLPCGEKVLFSIKEAVFKAVYPHDRVFLDFEDATVDRISRMARTRYGRMVSWRAIAAPRVLAVAWW